MDNAVSVIPFAFPGITGVRCAFGLGRGPGGKGAGNISLKVGGDPQAARENRGKLKQMLGFRAWRSLVQVHGAAMVFDPGADTLRDGGTVEADGLATARPGDALVIKTADCQPILLAHRDGAHIAALHAGWRGNVMNFPGIGVAAFCERYGLRPKDLMAVRGPSLGPAASEFVLFHEEFGSQFREYYDPAKKTVNLWRLTRDQLQNAGLPPDAIFGLDLCTASLPEFYSYRRDKNAGRQASFIWIDDKEAATNRFEPSIRTRP